MQQPNKPALRVQGVIFDMDGTLADSVGHYYAMACDIVDRAGAPPVSREYVFELMGSGDPELMRKLLPDDFSNPEATLAPILREVLPFWRKAGERLDPLAGCIALLRRLHQSGHRLAIVTSSGRSLPYLDRWGVRPLFDAIVGREDVSHRKPHPEGILQCLDALGLAPEQAVYVGDSPIDIEAGRAAGVYTVGVLTGTSTRETLMARSPDHVIEDAPGLLGLLDR